MLAGLFGLTAVVAGTFAAHVIQGRIEVDLLEIFEVGVRYQMFHALAILALAGFAERSGKLGAAAIWCWSAGIVIFAGSLYLLSLTGARWLGAITPIGGVLFVSGWVCIIISGVKLRSLK
ncbi:MAG: DUF423 domain-containing protein [Phycisphaeraceae bacterium]|nr:DUF423 domain-containing protein [Phycisphaeraceae bacterium]